MSVGCRVLIFIVQTESSEKGKSTSITYEEYRNCNDHGKGLVKPLHVKQISVNSTGVPSSVCVVGCAEWLYRFIKLELTSITKGETWAFKTDENEIKTRKIAVMLFCFVLQSEYRTNVLR